MVKLSGAELLSEAQEFLELCKQDFLKIKNSYLSI